MINGTITGAYPFGGTPSLAVDLNANSHKIINLATPTLSGDAANKGYVDGAISTATATLAPQSRTISTTTPLTGGGDLSADRTLALSYTGTLPFRRRAGSGICCGTSGVGRMAPGSGSSISADGYWGPNGDTSATATLVAPLLAPCNGTISALYVQGNANATGLANVTVHRSAGGATISYAATVITCAISSGAKACSDLAHSYTVTAGDLLLIRITTSSWNPPAEAQASVWHAHRSRLCPRLNRDRRRTQPPHAAFS